MYIYIFLSRDVGSMSKTESVIPPYTFHFRETTRCKALPRDLKSAYASALGCSEPCMAGHLCLKSLVGPIGQPSSTIICRQRILCSFSIFPGAAVSRMQSFRGCICAYTCSDARSTVSCCLCISSVISHTSCFTNTWAARYKAIVHDSI